MSKPTLPLPWYFTPAELAADWNVHPDRVLYYMDAGLIVPAAAVPCRRVPFSVPAPSPVMVLMLDGYASLGWDDQRDSATSVVGDLRCFQTVGLGFTSFSLTLDAPIEVRRSELVVCLDQREVLEETSRREKMNPVERRTLLQMIATLASKGYGTDLTNHYSDARMLCKDAALSGIAISEETVAKKLLEAREYLVTKV